MKAILALMVSGTLICCIDDDIVSICNEGSEDDSNTAIVFDISLDVVSGNATRANSHAIEYGEDIDNEIDIEGKKHDFRILIFDKNDKFLFEPTYMTEYTIKAIEEGYEYNGSDETNTSITENLNTKCWQVKIPTNVLEEAGVLETMENDGFKITVLANWPRSETNKLTFNTDDYLYKISHYWQDSEYYSNDTGRPEAYHHLTDNGKMGAYCSWYEPTYSSREDAADKIRNNSRPSGMPPYKIERQAGSHPHTYNHVWRVWHFGDPDDDYVNSLSNNSAIISAWSEKIEEDQKNYSLTNENIQKGFNGYGTFNTQDDGLNFTGVSGSGYDSANGGHLKVGKGLSMSDYETDTKKIETNRLYFTAYAQGTLSIIAKSGSSTKDVYLGIQTKENSQSNAKFRMNVKLSSEFKTYKFENISVTGTSSETQIHNPEIISVFAIEGTAHIKQIEYIEDYHLNYTDRQGKLPDEAQLIPMYGIQEYGAIGDYLTPGQTLNLSTLEEGATPDTYDRKKVYLLRSLAKVELYMPASWNPKHVYFRCMNHTSRCEPINVSTSTDKLWENIDQEIKNIKSYGYFYDKDYIKIDGLKANNDTERYATYRDRMLWFYKAWSKWNKTYYDVWNWNGKGYTPKGYVPKRNKDDKGNGIVDSYSETTIDHPNIFNSRIQRTDYCYFRRMETTNGKTRYLLYMPEKNIDDTGSVGKLGGTPKIPHIEIRFEGVNEDDNLDDNDCYRIYFMDYETLNNSIREDLKQVKEGYDGKEQKHDFMRELYPIMRNHIYRFTLSGDSEKFGEKSTLEVKMDVVPYGECWLEPEFGLSTPSSTE